MTKKPSQAQASCGKDGSGNVVVVVVVVVVVEILRLHHTASYNASSSEPVSPKVM